MCCHAREFINKQKHQVYVILVEPILRI